MSKQTAVQFLTGKAEHSHICASGSLYSFTMVEQYLNEFAGQNGQTLIEMEHERYEWAKITFPEATAFSSLLKAEDEIQEIKADIAAGKKEPQEYADAIMCIFDSAARQGITPEMIEEAYGQKVAINKLRRWIKNPDNTYSHVPYAQLTHNEQIAIDRATPWKSTPGGSYTPQVKNLLDEMDGSNCGCCCQNPGPKNGTAGVSECCAIHNTKPLPCRFDTEELYESTLCELRECDKKGCDSPEDCRKGESAVEAKKGQSDVEK